MKSQTTRLLMIQPPLRLYGTTGFLSIFRIPGMKAHVRLLEYIIDMWDLDQEHFMVGVQILPIEIKDIYFSDLFVYVGKL